MRPGRSTQEAISEVMGNILPQGEEERPSPFDTVIMDGVEICTGCGEPRTKVITWAGREIKVPCACSCIADAQARRAEREEAKERIRRIERLRGLSMLPGKYKLATFTTSTGGGKAMDIAKAYVGKWREMERRQQGLLFFGPVGTGKSHIAACIANALLEQETPVLVTSIIKVLAVEGEEAGMIRRSVWDARLVIIDDLGAERQTEYAQEQVFDFIDTVIRAGKPMIVTTNLTLVEMANEANINKKRVYDRVLEACFPVPVDGKSRRMVNAARRQAELKKLLGGD